jgi:hypothetical protein
MASQTDVLASGKLTATGQLLDSAGNNVNRARIKALYIVPGGTAGTLVFRDGGASGSILMSLDTVGSATTPTTIPIPGEGLLFRTNVYVALTSVTSVVAFYA